MDIKITVQFSLVFNDDDIIYHELKDRVFKLNDVEPCILKLFKDHKDKYYSSINSANEIDVAKSGLLISIQDTINDNFSEYIYEYTDVDEYLSDKSILRKDPFFSEYINNGKYLSLVKMINEGIKEIKISYDLDRAGYFRFNLTRGVGCIAKEILDYERLMVESSKVGKFKGVTLQLLTVKGDWYETPLDQDKYMEVCDMFNVSAEEQLKIYANLFPTDYFKNQGIWNEIKVFANKS